MNSLIKPSKKLVTLGTGKIVTIDRLTGRISVFLKNGLVSISSYMGDLNELRDGMTVLVGKVENTYVILNKANAIPRLSTSNTMVRIKH